MHWEDFVYFNFRAINKLEQGVRGDKLYLVEAKTVREGDYRVGVKDIPKLTKVEVPGYAINNMQSTGVKLQNGKTRYDGSYLAYLNVKAGFNPDLVKGNTYLMVNSLGLYEMSLIEIVRHAGDPHHYVYSLDETNDAKVLFQKHAHYLTKPD